MKKILNEMVEHKKICHQSYEEIKAEIRNKFEIVEKIDQNVEKIDQNVEDIKNYVISKKPDDEIQKKWLLDVSIIIVVNIFIHSA